MVMVLGFYLMRDNRTPDTPSHVPYTIQIMMQGRTQEGFRGGQPEYREFQVEPGGEMKSGQYFRYQITINNDAHVYVVFQDSSGAIQPMEAGFVSGGTQLSLPDGDNWFHLDENTGIENLYLVASRDKIEGFSGKVNQLKRDGIDAIAKVFPDTTVKSFSFQHQ